MKHKTIQQLRDNLKKVMKRARPKQLKKLRKAYHGKRLKKWWSDYANADGCNTIAELKDFEGAGHRLKGGKRHNHVRNATARMRKCHICGEPIVKGCEYTDGFSEFQCRSCRTEECREQACLVGLSFGGCEFKTRRYKK